MNRLEAQLHYPFGDALPAPGQPIEIADGIHWLRMPLPFALDHINLWLMRDALDGRDGWTVVDCGVATDEIRRLWERLFADGLGGLPVLRVLCTHMHPDHLGLAGWLTARFDAPLWMTLGEYGIGRVLATPRPAAADAMRDDPSAEHFARHGVAPAMVDAIRRRNRDYFATLVPSVPASFVRIADGDTLRIGGRAWRVIVGRGHSPEHAALYCADDRLLVSGDMVLPRISTNCSVYELEPLADPLRWYLDSLGRFGDCAEDTLVLPSHGRPFRGLATRIGQLVDHHDERFALVLAACDRRALTAADAVPVVFGREFDTHQTTFAVGEALAHLHALWYAGRLARRVGDDGIVRFEAACVA
ncbi:MAG: MBL fold metallo-hydrolase [Lautropia sp.]